MRVRKTTAMMKCRFTITKAHNKVLYIYIYHVLVLLIIYIMDTSQEALQILNVKDVNDIEAVKKV